MPEMTPKLKEICEGKTDLPLSKVNAYRKKLGMDPLEDDGRERSERVVHRGDADVPGIRSHKTTVVKPYTAGCSTCGNTPRRVRRRGNPYSGRLQARTVQWKDSTAPIVTIQTAIRTSHRVQPTLPETIDAMLAAGFQHPFIFAEPNAPEITDAVRWAEQKKPFRSFVAMCEWLLRNTQAYWFLLCEDDVVFRDGAADLIRTYPMHPGQSLSLYVSSLQQGRVGDDPGFKAISGDLHGSLAYLVHREAIEKILASTTFREWSGPARVDRAFSQAAEECGIDLVTHNPSLCQHIGETSTLNPNRRLTRGRLSRFVGSRHDSPSLTLITPTGDRQEAFALCERWIANQRYTGDFTWIVADDGVDPTACTMGQQVIRRQPGKGHTLCAQLRDVLPLVETDLILIIEDDEYYGPDYLSTMVGQLEHADLVGERASKYYFPTQRKWMQYPAWHHVALCRMGWRRSVLPTAIAAVTGTDHRSVDLRIWNAWTGSRRVWIDTVGDMRLSVGIKGMPGRACGVNRPPVGSHDDPNGEKLRQMLGNDADVYLQMYQPPLPSLAKQAAGFTKTVIQHVANGAKKSTAELAAERLKICEGCKLFRSEDRKCSACGCPVDRKVEWEVSECPQQKW